MATIKDKDQVLTLLDELGKCINRSLGKNKPENVAAQKTGGPIFAEIIKRSDTLIFVAEEKNKLLGVVTFYILPNIRHGWHRGHIEDFVVRQDCRGKGVGSALMKAVKDYCKKYHIKVIKLDSEIGNTDSHRSYEKNGGRNTEIMFRFDID